MSKKSPAKILKEKGLIPKEWDLRKPLSTGQKSWITKQSKAFAQLVKRPGDFTVRKGSKSTLKALRDAGYKTSGSKAVVPNHGASKISISGGKLKFMHAHKTETVILSDGPGFLERLESLEQTELAPNQAYGLKLGANPNNLIIHKSLKELIKYVSVTAWHSQSAMEHMSLVLIESKSFDLKGDNMGFN